MHARVSHAKSGDAKFEPEGNGKGQSPVDGTKDTPIGAEHHAGSGNLDRRGIGDVYTMTVTEYAARGRWRRLAYRLYRHPAVLFGLGPVYLFGFQHRVPRGMTHKGWRPWLTTMATNAAIVALCGVLIWLIGFGAFVAVHLRLIPSQTTASANKRRP